MDFLRRYLSIIIPAAILLVAVIFIVLSLAINTGVAKDLEQSISTGRRVSTLAQQVPSQRQPEIEAQYQDRQKEDVDRIEQLFIETTTRELISYVIFPEPIDTSRQIFTNYGDSYRERLAALISSMRAADAPSDNEISAVVAATGGGRTRNEESEMIIDAFCKDRALKAKVYAAPTIIPWFDFWRPQQYKFVSQNIAVQDCWNSQVAFWIYEDIAQTINQLNGSSRSIMDAPVKRIMGISFTQIADGSQARGSRTTTSSIDTPLYVTEQSPSIFVADSFTRRVSDENIDVVHFSLSLILAVNKIPDFMQAISAEKSHTFRGWDGKSQPKECKRNQITILKFDTSPIEHQSANHKYYRYGDNAVVQWTGVCEYIFSRKAYESVMPKSISDKISGAGEQRR